MSFPDDSAGKESACNAGDLASIPRFRRASEEGNSYPLQYSGLVNSMDSVVHGVTKGQTRMRDFHFFTLLYRFPGGTSGKEFTCKAIRDADWIPGSGRSPGGGLGDPLQ